MSVNSVEGETGQHSMGVHLGEYYLYHRAYPAGDDEPVEIRRALGSMTVAKLLKPAEIPTIHIATSE